MIAAVLLAACTGSSPCATAEESFAVRGDDVLRCGAAQDVFAWAKRLAGRPLGTGTEGIHAALREDFRANEGPMSAVDRARRDRALIAEAGDAWAMASARSAQMAALVRGRSDWGPADGRWARAVSNAAAVWAVDASGTMALTESDIEGFLHLASLLRELQGGGPLRLSVADRQELYRDISDQFLVGSENDRAALVAIGPFWQGVTASWRSASYEQQQAFARAAPLPPPMEGTSKDYVRAVLQSDLPALVRALHQVLGPIPMDP